MKAINSSRQKIVEDIRKAMTIDNRNNGFPKLPSMIINNDIEDDLNDRFAESLKIAGAEVATLNVTDLDDYLKDKFSCIIDFRDRRVWDLYQGMKPVELAKKTECILLPGKLGVAENGAIWIDDDCFPERLLPFVTGELVLLVREKTIVSDMHAAYDVINERMTGFGVFISGPSKTADIEQSLVYGAHGAISLEVVILKG